MDFEKVTIARNLLPKGHTFADWGASALPLSTLPSSFVVPHHASVATLNDARAAVRGFVGDSGHKYHVIFTSGTTSSFHLLAHRIPWSEEDMFVCHAHCHNSLLGIRNTAGVHNSRFRSLGTTELDVELSHRPRQQEGSGFAVLAFPAECNLTGSVYPLEWAARAKKNGLLGYAPGKTVTIVDTAKYLSSTKINADENPHIDAFVFSLYKLSSSHTGLGILLIRKKSFLESLLLSTGQSAYFAGQSSEAISPFSTAMHFPSLDLERSMSLGTPNLQAIKALPSQLALFQDMESVHTVGALVGSHFKKILCSAFTSAVIHEDENAERNPATTSFTLYRGSFPIGHNEIGTVLSINNVYVRSGTMCNIGATASVLRLSDADLKRHYDAGHRCGDKMDLIGGRPTGVVRVSFGWGSLICDAEAVVRVLRNYVCVRVLREVPGILQNCFRISELYMYPVKGCGGRSVSRLIGHRGGVLGDRAFGIADESTGRILGVRVCEALTKLSAFYAKEGETLVIEVRKGTQIAAQRLCVDLRDCTNSVVDIRKGADENTEGTSMCCVDSAGDKDRPIVGGRVAADWLSAVVRRRVQLVRLDALGQGLYKGNVLLVSGQELRTLSNESKIRNQDVLKAAIRPNIVLEHVALADAGQKGSESRPTSVTEFSAFRGSSVLIRRQRSCTRCKVVNIIARSMGIESDGEPLRSIASLSCRQLQGGLVFGLLAGLDLVVASLPNIAVLPLSIATGQVFIGEHGKSNRG